MSGVINYQMCANIWAYWGFVKFMFVYVCQPVLTYPCIDISVLDNHLSELLWRAPHSLESLSMCMPSSSVPWSYSGIVVRRISKFAYGCMRLVCPWLCLSYRWICKPLPIVVCHVPSRAHLKLTPQIFAYLVRLCIVEAYSMMMMMTSDVWGRVTWPWVPVATFI